MYYNEKIWIGDADGEKICIEPKMANRHGLIAGATGTGKTVTLKVLAESFSDAGVPVFLADIKGDLSGMCRPGADSEEMQKRIRKFGLEECGFRYQAYPSVFWDIYGKMGIPARTTISEMGPVLLSRLMDLNDTQSDILTIVFQIADDQNLLLIDTKDLKSMLQYVSEHSAELSKDYGNIAKQSVAAILRNVVALEAQGGRDFFGEPALNLSDWFFGGTGGKGPINILDCRQLVNDTTLYSTFLLWLLSELFETLPEVGDMDKLRMVFFFDEAHLLFKDISKALQSKIEQVVKLIRSKGVGVYFITQSPKDIPDGVLAQLGNKIQHALRAYTPAEEKAVRAAASAFRANPAFDTYETLTALGTGEALVSTLDEEGIPGMVRRCRILPPQSMMGPVSDEEKQKEVLKNNLYLKYQEAVDRDSAYEFFQRMEQEAAVQKEQDAAAAAAAKERSAAAKAEEKARMAEEKKRLKEDEKREREARNRRKQVASTAAGTIGRELGNAIGKSVGGSFGKKLGGNVGASLARNILGTFMK
ncbi:MAG: DUF853 family protein [Firmicutes bacterium]|nr:DUF853 family protein [Bacillota bacterium]MDY5856960.1 helicase HerA-like domain-containing protein [Anaerovoracaceae bacterium]